MFYLTLPLLCPYFTFTLRLLCSLSYIFPYILLSSIIYQSIYYIGLENNHVPLLSISYRTSGATIIESSELTREWTFITSYFSGHPTSNLRERLPSIFLDADVLKGAISTTGGRRGAARVPGTET